MSTFHGRGSGGSSWGSGRRHQETSTCLPLGSWWTWRARREVHPLEQEMGDHPLDALHLLPSPRTFPLHPATREKLASLKISPQNVTKHLIFNCVVSPRCTADLQLFEFCANLHSKLHLKLHSKLHKQCESFSSRINGPKQWDRWLTPLAQCR